MALWNNRVLKIGVALVWRKAWFWRTARADRAQLGLVGRVACLGAKNQWPTSGSFSPFGLVSPISLNRVRHSMNKHAYNDLPS